VDHPLTRPWWCVDAARGFGSLTFNLIPNFGGAPPAESALSGKWNFTPTNRGGERTTGIPD